jgi:hypothetical protein
VQKSVCVALVFLQNTGISQCYNTVCHGMILYDSVEYSTIEDAIYDTVQ